MEWRKGPETLRARDRVSLRQDGAVCELEIRELTVEDAGEYSCMCGQEKTSAMLAVRGKDRVWPHGLAFGGCCCLSGLCRNPRKTSRVRLQRVLRPDSPTMTREQ